jgi:bifunctional non-homologous end joining protein LigD
MRTAAIPQRFVAKSGPSNRKGKIFIDFLRNGQSQFTAATFSACRAGDFGVHASCVGATA